MGSREHWRAIWAKRADDELSWTQAHPAVSLRLIDEVAPDRSGRIVDLGGGASTLVDHLLDSGYTDVTVVDIAPEALDRARARLGDRADEVAWIVADVTRDELGGPYEVWHDRAVFHFLTDEADRAAYRDALASALASGGHAIVSTFAPDGPETCSGLPVRRYDGDALAAELGEGWMRVASEREVHRTPWGAEQPFQYVALRHP